MKNLESKVKNYQVVDIGAFGPTRDKSATYATLILEEADNPNVVRGDTQPFLNLFNRNTLGKMIIGKLEQFKDENGKLKFTKDQLKDAMPVFRGVFGMFPVHPYYVIINGEQRKYQNGDNAGQPVISAQIPLFIFENELNATENIIMRSMNNRKLVPLEETDNYSGAPHEILRKARAERKVSTQASSESEAQGSKQTQEGQTSL